MKIAFCYDRVNKFGGAERVLQALHELWPEAPVYTLTYDASIALWAEGWDIRSSFLQKIPLFGKKHELFPALAPLAWEQFDFNKYDVVISVTSSEAKCIITSPNTLHICYCLTPTRYFWSGYFEYLSSTGFGLFHGVVKRIFSFLAHPLRVWDYFYAQRPDIIVGISDEVCNRIHKYYRRESKKIYPPVDLILKNREITSSDRYFLVVSRLVPYKKVDIVVEAFNQLGWPLKVIGTGSELIHLKQRARSNIEFLGFLNDKEIHSYYCRSAAVIFPAFEDFGIVPVEAQACGKPVIAYGRGGALETVIEGKTGCFFSSQTPESIISLFEKICDFKELSLDIVIAYLEQFKKEDCIANAERFSKVRFQKKIKELVESAVLSVA